MSLIIVNDMEEKGNEVSKMDDSMDKYATESSE
jgi:hypothetical protein